MNFSGYELQIFVSVLIVLGCAFVALLVDYLKGSNEKLRESHVDLLARQDSVVSRASADTSMLLKALGEQTSALRAMISRPIHVTAVAAPAVSAPVSLANFPVTSIPTPRREAVETPAPELEKVKVALIPETRVVNPEPAPMPAVEPVAAPVFAEPVFAAVAAPVEEKAQPTEEVLPPNVIRIRLMPEVVRQEVKAEEPVAVEAVAVEAVAVEAVAVEAVAVEAVAVEAVAVEAPVVAEVVVAEEVVAVAEEVAAPEVVAPEVIVEAVAEVEIAANAVSEIEEAAPSIAWEGSIDSEELPEPVEITAAVAEPVAEPEAAPDAEPDFDRFLDDLVTEFESQPDIYQDRPSPEVPSDMPMSEPEPVHSYSSEPLMPVLLLQPESDFSAGESFSSNVEELTPNLDVPVGTHSPSVLAALLERKELLTGLVVSVGINEYGQINENLGRSAAEELLRSVDSLMGSLAGDEGFCTRKTVDEFILIFPKISGPTAQRRLSELSERLWDFQLRNLGTFSVVFSWGASEAQREVLSEAISSANERMSETQTSRKTVSMDRSRRRRATA